MQIFSHLFPFLSSFCHFFSLLSLEVMFSSHSVFMVQSHINTHEATDPTAKNLTKLETSSPDGKTASQMEDLRKQLCKFQSIRIFDEKNRNSVSTLLCSSHVIHNMSEYLLFRTIVIGLKTISKNTSALFHLFIKSSAIV